MIRGNRSLSLTARERAKVQPPAVILDSQRVKNTATGTRRVGYGASKRIKSRKRFFLVDTLGNLLASYVVAASCPDEALAAQVWDALAPGNELLDQVQPIFVDRSLGRRFRQQLAQRGIVVQVPTGAKDYERKPTYANAWLYVADSRRLARLT